MKKATVVLSFFFLCCFAAQADILDNAAVVALTKAGIDPTSIVKMIEMGPTKFEITVNTLIALKNEGVEQTVLQAMIAASQNQKESATTSAFSDSNKTTSTVKIPDKTIVRLVVAEPISSRAARQNDIVRLEVAEDVLVNGAVVIAKGAEATGHVTAAKPRAGHGEDGKIEFTLDSAKAVDDSNVRLEATVGKGGKQSKVAMMAGMIGKLKKGKDVEIAKGETVNAFVDGEKEVRLGNLTASK